MVFVYISQAQVHWKVQNNTSHGLKIDRRVKVLLVMLGIECLCLAQVHWKVQNNTSHGLKIDRRVKVLVMLGIECLCFSVFLSAVMTLLEDVKSLCTDITATLCNNKSL